MTDILTPPSLILDTFMCSQSGNIHDLSACSDHSILDNDSEPDISSSLSRQGISHQSIHSEMGMRYLTDDVRFNSDPDSSHHSPVYSIEPTIPTSAFLPYTTNLYQPTTYSSGGSSFFPPGPSLFSVPDIKPRLGSLTNSPGMALSRSSGLPNPASPLPLGSLPDTRRLYTSGTPHLPRRSDLLSRSPPAISIQGAPDSPTSSGFASPTNMENALGGQASPPLHATEVIYQLQTTDGQMIRPEIFGKIDKGFFMADNDWTCYRRNYFSLNCSYTLHPAIPTGTIHLVQGGNSRPQVYEFAISIAAVVDGRDGKAIELVQHTPKRDKGPQDKPSRITLQPRPPPSAGMYGGGDGQLGGGSRGLYDQGYGPTTNQQAMEATFERIQFKNATANNGKRRAAQQYYHLLVELFADVGQQHPDRWIKIATRMSAPMVVRGRSPGHYQNERRGSNASTGPSGGAGGGGAFSPSGSSSRTSDMGMGGSSMSSSSGYNSAYDTRSHHYRSNIAPLQIPMEPTLSAEEAKSIEESPGYLYYASPIWEGNENRYLPNVSEYSNKVKQEYGSSYTLPSLMHNHQDSLGRQCGRWDGVPESKGYFPTALMQQEMNIH